MKNKFFLIFFFIFIILASAVFAVPPFVEQSEGSIFIEYPKNPSFEKGNTFPLHFHIFNSTGGELNTSQVYCYIHVYDNNNHHIIENDLLNDSNGIDKYITINSSISDNTGVYPYIVYCESDTETGFESVEFIVSSENGL